MSKVKIETLTPIHIGSGSMLYKGMDYVIEKGKLYVIDHHKVLNIIGPEKIDSWVSSIEKNEDLAAFISRQGIDVASPMEYAKREMECYSNGITVKECIHDGRGLAYIPGSSIKGAIRTAVLATELKGNENSVEHLIGFRKETACSKIEEKVFSKPAPEGRKGITASNTSFMRFLQIGDAYFYEGCECVLNAINLNIRSSHDSLVDGSKPQAIEAISCEQTTEFDIRLNQTVLKNDKGGIIQTLPASMKSLENLFKTINKHTKKLLKEELEYWKEISKDFSDADSYIEFIEDLVAEIDEIIEGKECVLRIGHASGWRFTTGAWAENLNCFNEKVVPMSRPKNERYAEYDFPKSRRVYEIEDKEVDILGFVKLTLI